MLGLITAIMRPFLYRTALLIVVVVRPSVRPSACLSFRLVRLHVWHVWPKS